MNHPPRDPHPDQGAPEPELFEEVVSGAFDAEQEATEPAVGKRVLQPQVDTPKLHKVLAQAGLGSRLEMEQMILEGRISVNGEPAHIGQRIQYGDSVKINGKPIRVRIAPPPPRVCPRCVRCWYIAGHDLLPRQARDLRRRDPSQRVAGLPV